MKSPMILTNMTVSQALQKVYDASSVEDGIYHAWEASGAFNPDTLPERNQAGDPYCIVMPPPNVTGVLHLGHALENALMDTMARFQRMRGKRVLLIPGTDHAAIATQAKVEKMLIEQGMKNPRQELGREKLVEKIREFATGSMATILAQIRKMGTTCDWSHVAYTFDDQRNLAVKELFVRMYNDGLIYRGYRVVNWSVKGQSTCSDDEIEYVERPSKLYTFKYDKDFPISIATTRPETKLGDTAVAVHPSDERYRAFIGKIFSVDVGAAKPLEIKIIADENVDPTFGTGALGVTPAHSAIDFAIYEKQKIKGDPIGLIPVIGADGKMTIEAGAEYAGLTVEEAREKFISRLKTRGLLVSEEDIVQNAGRSDRYKDVIEAIPMTQWWLDMNKTIPKRGRSLRDLMREAVTSGLQGDVSKKVTITPERFTKLYLDRIENLRDWCLSRQLWWGHRIPVWYRGDEVYVGVEAPRGEDWKQDPDTLDTWFSAGSWTFSTLGWPKQTTDLLTFHPTNWIQMGYEILYLWLMRMILMSAYALNDIPFQDAYIHGMLCDQHGNKFSKSVGNGIDPIEVIGQYGCDALRISLLIGITPGNDLRYYTEKIESGRNFTNKLWNIGRFILMQIGDDDVGARHAVPLQPHTLADHWILSRLSEITSSVTQKLERYEFSSAGEELRDFTWNDLADWYLEIAKIEKGKSNILRHILQAILRLWHPFMPFVTEELWKQAGFEGQLILAEWPAMKVVERRELGVAQFDVLRNLITDIRRLRAEQKLEPSQKIEIVLLAEGTTQKLVDDNLEIVKRLVRASSIVHQASLPSGWASAASGKITIGVNVNGHETTRLRDHNKMNKELAELETYIASQTKKLKNKEFLAKAPKQIVEKMREKLKEAEGKRERLRETVILR